MEPSNSTSSDETLANDSPVDNGRLKKNAKGGEKTDKGKRKELKRDIERVLERDEPSPDKVWVPREHSNRTLVLCFDGTGDHFDSDVRRTRYFSACIH